jgi:hypothetical protein
MDTKQLEALYHELVGGKRAKQWGRGAMTALALVTSLIPVVGGPTSIAVDKLSDKLFTQDVSVHLEALNVALQRIAPEIDRIDAFDKRLQRLSEAASSNAELIQLLENIAAASAVAILDDLTIVNVGGVNEIKRVVVENMRLQSTASVGAVTNFTELKHAGSARFDTDHAKQTITDSHFTGRTGGFSSELSIRNAVLGQGTVEHHVVRDGGFVGLQITRHVGPNDPGGATLSIISTFPPKTG